MAHLGASRAAEDEGGAEELQNEDGHPERSRSPVPRHQWHTRRSRPGISPGASIPRSPSTVGATSRSEPPARSDSAAVPTAPSGTGLVVYAPSTPPSAGSIIISQLPWSAVTSTLAPARSAVSSTR